MVTQNILFKIGEKLLNNGVIDWENDDIRIGLIDEWLIGKMDKYTDIPEYLISHSSKIKNKTIERHHERTVFGGDDVIIENVVKDYIISGFLLYCKNHRSPIAFIRPSASVISTGGNVVVNFKKTSSKILTLYIA